jgi:O-antigen ligase
MDALVLSGIFFLPFSKSAAEAFFIAALVWWAVLKIAAREPLRLPSRIAWLHALFLSVVLLSVFLAPAELRTESWRGFFKWLKFTGVFFLVYDRFHEPAKAKNLIAVFLFSTALLTLNGFWQMTFGKDLITHHSVDIPGRLTRMRSSLGSPNGLAAFYLFSIPLAFAAWLGEKRWTARAIFFASVLALSVTGLGLTLSRAAVFALLIAVGIYFLSRRNWKTLAVFAGAAAVLLVSSGTMRENFLKSLNRNDETISERVSFWKSSWRMAQQKPLLGHGANTYYKLFPKYAPAGETYRGYAHNCYLQMACETGAIGLVLFLAALGAVFAAYFRRGGEGALFIGASAFLIQAGFDTHFYSLQLSYLFWTFWALFAASSLKTK